MEEFSYELKIPKERVAVLIGKKGETKRKIEELTNTKMLVDSKEGDIFVSGNDALSLFSVKDILKAIGRGFNPDVALQILKPDYVFEMIEIGDFARTQNDSLRLKGRVIGTEGKSRSQIEELTETNICVYGKTIGIVGRQDNVPVAKRAIDMLLSGSPHANVYKWLERMRRSIKGKEPISDDMFKEEKK